MEQIRQRAQATRERIAEKLQALVDSIETGTRIPANASPKLRAFLEKQNSRQKAAAKNAAGAELQKVGEGNVAAWE